MRRGHPRRDGVAGFLAAALRVPANARTLSELRAAHDLGVPYSEWAGGPRGEPWTDHDRLLHLAVRAYLADLCPGCGWPKEYSTNPAAEEHWSAPLPVRCHACTAIETRAKKYHKVEAPGALLYHAEPSEGLAAAMADPTLKVAPPLPTGTTGRLHATPGQMAAWLTHHGLPVPDELAQAVPAHDRADEHHPALTT